MIQLYQVACQFGLELFLILSRERLWALSNQMSVEIFSKQQMIWENFNRKSMWCNLAFKHHSWFHAFFIWFRMVRPSVASIYQYKSVFKAPETIDLRVQLMRGQVWFLFISVTRWTNILKLRILWRLHYINYYFDSIM